MILDPRFQQAIEGKLSDADWQKLLADPTLRQALAAHLRLDAALKIAFETESTALEESILASAQTLDSSALEARILASTQASVAKPMRPNWHYHAFAAAAATLLLIAGAGLWLHLSHDASSIALTQPKSAPHSPLPPTTPTSPTLAMGYEVAQRKGQGEGKPNSTVSPPTLPPEEAHKSMIPIPFSETKDLPQRMAERPMEALPPPVLISTVAQAPKDIPMTVTAKTTVVSDEPAPLTVTLPSEGERVQFEKHVLPLLERSCFECHSAKLKKPKGGIRLDDLATIRAKSKTDNLVFPHKPERSTLLKSITLEPNDDNFMPPNGKGKPLSPEEVATVKRWLDEGASFGTWTSTQAKTLIVKAKDEIIDTSNVQAVVQRINELIYNDLQAHNAPVGEPANDHTFARRVYLDLVGRIPSFTELQKFLKDKAENKRALLIDELLASNGHASHMFNYWADLLRAKEELADNVDGKPYLLYIKQSVRDNKPYDQWARELLSPEGFGWQAPATGYYLRDGANRNANIESTASLFLGTQISCAQCHDHPFDQWTRMDYHQFLAFTSGIKASNDDSDVGMVGNEMIQTITNRYNRLGERSNNMERKQKYLTLAEKVKALQATSGGAGLVNGEAVTAMLPGDYQYPDAQPGQAIEPKVLFGDKAEAYATRPADGLAQWDHLSEEFALPSCPRQSPLGEALRPTLRGQAGSDQRDR